MIYHVLPGDSLVDEFKKTHIEGEVIVCREALVDGPIDADTLDEFWDQRARFILAEHGDDEIEYHEKVADSLNRLTEIAADDEVNLWFEYELFCSVNMWFCLSLLRETGAAVYRVEPIGLDEGHRWDGFAKFTAEDLQAAFELRTQFTKEEIALGTTLWNTYRRKNYTELRAAAAGREWPCFPYLAEVIAAAADEDIAPLEAVREIQAGGECDFGGIFEAFKQRAGVYGYGDVQVRRLIERSSA